MSKPKVYTHIARLYDILDLPFEYGRYRHLREALWQGLSSRGPERRILDAGVGTGRNMAYYPKDALLTGIDLSPAMLARAHARRDRSGVEVELREMDVCQTDFPDGHFDAVISSFLFCVLDDSLQLPALKELRRICKDNGEVHVLEYAYSSRPIKRFIMRLWAPWVKFAYGASFERNTEQYAEAAQFELAEVRFLYQDIIKLLIFKPKGWPKC